jgi:sugar lactone lactonase YvrE
VVGRGLRTLVDDLDHPEGVCWSPSEQALSGEPDPVIELERAVPDGLAFDADGGLWVGVRGAPLHYPEGADT